MVIHKIKSQEDKEDQHWCMVLLCQFHWRRLNNAGYQSYTDIMNMKAYRYNDEHECHVAITYHFKSNKW